MTFDEAFDKLLGHEGGYSNRPSDPGGETMWGVTARVARAHGYTGRMIDLPKPEAKRIYRADYWTPIKADQLPAQLRFDVFDGAVNSGVAQSAKWLQRAVGVRDDGTIGPQTIAAASATNAAQVAKRYNGQRLRFMTDLPGWSSSGKGWARRIAENLLA